MYEREHHWWRARTCARRNPIGRAATVLTVAVLAAGTGMPAQAQCELNKKTPSDAEAGDLFGRAVAVDGSLAVVGANQDKIDGIMSGSAAVFARDSGGTDNWAQVAKLAAADGQTKDDFGYTVSISLDTVVIGVPRDDDDGANSGSAYVFSQNHGGPDNWGQVRKVTAGDPGSKDRFGNSVSLSGDTLVVGANQDDDQGSNSGSAYVFHRNAGGANAWGQVAKLTANDGVRGDNFGISVSVHGDFALVGAHRDDDAGRNSGAAYVFYRDAGGSDAWGQVRKLTASDGAADHQFGMSVSINGNIALVGAYTADSKGAAYIFGRAPEGPDLWGEVTKLSASDGEHADSFGYTVSLSGSFALVSAVGDDDAGTSSGSAYLFGQDEGGTDNWGEITKLLASDGALADLFGLTAAVGGDVVLVGSVYDDDAGPNSGSAYLFTQDQGGVDAWGEVKKLVSVDGVGDHFGHAVAIDGDFAIAGAPLDDVMGEDSGSASVYFRDAQGADFWGRVAKLEPAAARDEFGGSVAISGETALVGASGDTRLGPYTGAAYVFDRNQGGTDVWGQVDKFVAGDGSSYDHFGKAVAIDGDVALIGAPYEQVVGTNSGAVYVFERSGGVWSQADKLIPLDAAEYDHFGIAVSISGDWALIGADGTANPDPSHGAAYVFFRNGGAWSEIATLTANDSLAYDQFGYSVSISGTVAAVGCPFDDDGAVDAGSTYVFERDAGGPNNWGVVDKLLGDYPMAESGFGVSVSIAGDTLLVGSDEDDTAVASGGAVYVFDRDQDGPGEWGQLAQFVAADPASESRFGVSVAVSNDRALVGAELDDQAGPDAGAVFVLDLAGEDCNENRVCDAIEILNGSTADQNENGIPDECECLADLTGDDLVDWMDLQVLWTQWGPCEGCSGDLTFDGEVGMADLLICTLR